MNPPGGWEIILVLLVVVLVFGSKRLPDSARALGRSMRILKAETKGLRDDDTSSTTTTAHVVEPIAPAQAVQPTPAPVQAWVEPQPYAGQQLFDAQGRPVQLPASGSAPVQSAQQAPHQQV